MVRGHSSIEVEIGMKMWLLNSAIELGANEKGVKMNVGRKLKFTRCIGI